MKDATVAQRARNGAFALVGRQFVLFPVGVVTGIILARLLSASQFGEYASATFVVMTAGSLLEFGLGAIIIQQMEEPTSRQLRSIFTAQLVVFGTAAGLLGLLAPLAAAVLHLPPDGAWIVRAMSLHMIFASLGTNSTLLLERRMSFDTFARLDIVCQLGDRGLTLVCALLHFGAWSFVIGSLASMALRVTLLFASAPWSVGLAFDRVLLGRALRFGLTLQATNLTTILRENLNTLVGGGVFGPRAVGILNWGANLPTTCANWMVQIVTRVSYPAFARLQDDAPERERVLNASLRSLNLVSYPAMMMLVALGPHIVTFVYSDTWRAGLFALNCFVLRTMCTNVTSVCTGFLNATGRAVVALRIAAFWTVVEVALAIALVPSWGFNGVALACAVGPLLPLAMFLLAVREGARVAYWRVFGVPLLAGFAAAGAGYLASGTITTLAALFAALILSGGAAMVVITTLEREFLQAGLLAAEQRIRRALREREVTNEAGPEPFAS